MWTNEFPPLAGFASRKAAQLSVYFLADQPDMDKLKLIKLIYLTERAFLARHGHPMLYDEFYSLKDGPICSSTLNAINGNLDQDYWRNFLVPDENRRKLHLQRDLGRDDLDELSDADIEVAEEILRQFRDFTASQLRKWTHEHCPEYKEVETGRLPISYRDLMEAMGHDDGERVEEEILQTRRAASILGL